MLPTSGSGERSWRDDGAEVKKTKIKSREEERVGLGKTGDVFAMLPWLF